MALGTFCAGPYTGAFTPPGGSALPLGLTQEGYRISWQQHWEDLRATDAYGDSLIEKFAQGLDMRVAAVFHERKAGPMTLVSPWDTVNPTGNETITMPVIGKQASDLSGSLVLTVVAGSIAATNGPTTMTFPLVILDQSAVEFMFGPKHQVIPFSGSILPYSSSGIKFGTAT